MHLLYSEIIRNSYYKVVGFSNPFAAYGRLRGQYQLEFKSPLWRGRAIKIYKGSSKPIIRSLIVPTLLGLLFTLILLPIWLMIWLGIVLLSFYATALFEGSFINSWEEKLSGAISLTLSIVGAGYLISLCF